RRRPMFTLFPYTTLFRSAAADSPLRLPAVRPVWVVVGNVFHWSIADPTQTDSKRPCRICTFILPWRLGVLAFNFLRPPESVCIGDRKSTRLNSSHVKISY